MIVKLPCATPAAVGANFTLIVQFPPGGTLAAHVFVSVNIAELVATDTPVSAAVPTFVSVTVCAALVLPTFAFPKARPVGESETTVLARLPPLMNTFESSTKSIASAIASLMWLFEPGVTFALAVSITVIPSISVLNGATIGN